MHSRTTYSVPWCSLKSQLHVGSIILPIVLALAACGSKKKSNSAQKSNPAPISSGTCAGSNGNGLPAARFWRLTDIQIRYTLEDAFGSGAVPEFAGFRSERFKERFENDPTRLLISPDLVLSSLDAVKPVSDWILQNVPEAKACRASSGDSCIHSLKSKYAPLLWRGAVSDEEFARLGKVLEKASAMGATQEEKIKTLFDAILLAPRFIYRSEIGRPEQADGKTLRKLDSYEVANLLSYTLWSSLPDKTLLGLASQNKLSNSEAIMAQVLRMEADPKIKRGVQGVFDSWLGLRQILTKVKDPTYTDLTSDIRNDMREESTRFLENLVWTKKAPLSEIFSSKQTYVNSRLANYYGMAGVGGNDFVAVTADGSQRAGILSSGAFITSFSNDKGTGMVHRADFALKHLLCSPLPPPPPGVVNTVVNADGEMTTRQKFEKLHSSKPACAGCHKSLDPIGGAFESWDSIGRYRSKEGNLPIDSSGELFLKGKSEITYQNGVEFLEKLAESDRLAQCYSVKTYQAALGVAPSDNFNCEVAKVHSKMKELGFKPAAMFQAIAGTRAMLYREERSEQ